ncbi:MAG: recombination factor protein RarA, partial [Moraxellaceae bacterium]|nr:recombination factor protein RarA [Moraxellaceae bacterium]
MNPLLSVSPLRGGASGAILQFAQSKSVVRKIVHEKRCFVQILHLHALQVVDLKRVQRIVPVFNKAQQDAFLPHVESGLFTFIGATTENPSFEVNAALLSRATVHVLRGMDEAAMQTLLTRGQAELQGPSLTPEARARLIAYADGDARRVLNTYETLAGMLKGRDRIDEVTLEKSLGEQLRRYDKGGDQFYDTISALHKSVRGSDPDAALYWFVRMVDGGVDPRYIVRRLIRMASEDIGLA